MASTEQNDPRHRLAEILADRPDLASAAIAIFDYSQYLLDDDERLTKNGALDGVGRDQLRQRALETLGGPAIADETAESGDDEEDDDEDDDENEDDEDREEDE
jgi:hypothetical protein